MLWRIHIFLSSLTRIWFVLNYKIFKHYDVVTIGHDTVFYTAGYEANSAMTMMVCHVLTSLDYTCKAWPDVAMYVFLHILSIETEVEICHKSRPSCYFHYNNVIMSSIASQITSLTIVYSTVYSDADQRKHQSSASLAFVYRGPVNSPHKWPVTRKMFPFDDVIMSMTITTIRYR